MLFKDSYLLEKAYLSVSQPMASVPSDEEEVVVQSVSPEVGVQMSQPEVDCGCEGDCSYGSEVSNAEEEHEEDSMAVDNLNSVRESTMKIAQFWAQGGHLETWQLQKLAIVMNSLADIARSLR